MKIRLIIGLGNPGKEYAETYHNLGFLAVDALEAHRELLPSSLFIKKSTQFMNEAGLSVKHVLAEHHLSPEALLVIHDDSDLPLGESMLVFGRGAGGHKGVEDIIERLGTNEFWRLRIGFRDSKEIANPKERAKASELVLQPIGHAAWEVLEPLFDKLIPKIQAMTV